MYKRNLFIFLFILSFCLSNGQDRTNVKISDSNIEKLNGYINGYLALTPINTDSLITACDYLIAFSKDSLIKSYIAQYLFSNFYNSQYMGMESVAIHIAKNYYLNGKLKLPNKEGFDMLQLYVDFNEKSLLGMDAPELMLKNMDGVTIPLRKVEADYLIVFFFDSQCPTCLNELPKLKTIVKKYKSVGLKVYAVYTQSDRKSYLKFIDQEFRDTTYRENWIFTWDPEFVSNFHKLYNVMKTPQIFLLDYKKTIIGRNLDSSALEHLLELSCIKEKKPIQQ
jgi:hypothetical protein